jgi:hypothetical protein
LRGLKHFTSWNQLPALMFAQLSNRERLRDLAVALKTHLCERFDKTKFQNNKERLGINEPSLCDF